jgi:hypothetical protein
MCEIKDIKNKIEHSFITFADWNSAMKYVTAVPKNERHFHEIILDNQPQKLKFDIDINRPLLPNILNEESNVLEKIILYIRDTFYMLYGIDLSEDNEIDSFVITSSTRPTKISYHITIKNYHVKNTSEAAYFTRTLFSLLPEDTRSGQPLANFTPSVGDTSRAPLDECSKADFPSSMGNIKSAAVIDPGVNKTIQNFRLVNCTKINHGKDSFKKIISPGKKWYDAVVTFISEDSQELPPQAKNLSEDTKFAEAISIKNHLSESILKSDLEKIIEFLKKGGWIEGCRYDRMVNNNLILFKRFQPGKCRLCKREHQNENSPFVIICPDNSILFKCRRSSNNKGKVIVNAAALKSTEDNIQNLQQIISKNAENDDRIILENIGFYTNNQNNINGYTAEIYSEPILRDFPDCRTLFIRAAMKMGKTKTLIKYLNNFYSNNSSDKIVILSFRQTFSNAIKTSLKNGGQPFDLYSDFRGEIDLNLRPKVILQVESFFRLLTHAAPDLLILDESESIIEQLESGLSRNSSYTWAVFEWLIKYSKKIICMDAHLSRRTSNVIMKIRPNKSNTFYQINTFQNAKNDKYFIYSDKFVWLKELFAALENGKKIVLPISSLIDAETIAAAASKKFPHKNITIFTSKTSMSAKRAAFDDVSSAWAGLDLLIYTPTVSAGVSFELSHFDLLFGYFINLSCPVETVIQMIGRVRNIKSKEHHIMINEERKIFKPYTAEDIERQIHTARMSLWSPNSEHNITLPDQIPLELDESGRPIIHKSSFYTMWIENEICRNKSKSKFSQIFIDLLKQYGASFTVVAENNNLQPLQHLIEYEEMAELFGEQKKEIKNVHSAFIAAAPNIDEESAQVISQKIQRAALNSYAKSDELTDIERASFKKFTLKKIYELPEEETISADFIIKFDRRQVKEVFKNIQLIGNKSEDVEQKLEKLREFSKENFNNRIVNNNEEEINHDRLLTTSTATGNNESSGETRPFGSSPPVINNRSEGEIQDLKDKHLYQKHKLAIDILKEFGFKSPYDENIIGESNILEVLKTKGQKIINNCLDKSIYLPEGTSSFEYLQKKGDKTNNNIHQKNLIFINDILNSIYGIKIRPRQRDKDLFEIGRISEAWNLIKQTI